MLMTQVVAFLEITVVGHEDTCLALYRFYDKATHLIAIFVQCLLQGFRIIIRNTDKARGERTVFVIRAGVVTHGDHSNRAAMEIAFAADDLYLVIRNILFDSTPATCQFQGGLHTLGTCIHRQDPVVSEILVHELLILTQGIVVESA